jgi:four helix bundle protein
MFSRSPIASLWTFPDRRKGFRFTSSLKSATSPRGEISSGEYRGAWAKRASPSQFKRYPQILIGSCNECKFWLELTRDEGYLNEKESSELSNRFNLLGAMLKSLWNQWKSFER